MNCALCNCITEEGSLKCRCICHGYYESLRRLPEDDTIKAPAPELQEAEREIERLRAHVASLASQLADERVENQRLRKQAADGNANDVLVRRLTNIVCAEFGQGNPLVPGLRRRIRKRIKQYLENVDRAENVLKAGPHEGNK